ncbi:hypothetical protein F4819DRAFT_484918 [Hypoxylon fuscum]|nr:hypothetical protein F4819DRAFT_484918 [Hypoxylon fuscum]
MAAAVQVMHSSASSNHQQAAPSTAPVLEFVCLFTHDLRRKQKRWQDGRLKFHTFNKRIMVHDDRGNFIGDTHWREDYEFEEGEELQLERGGVIVQVAECTGSRDQDLSELVDKRAREKAERQAAAIARRPPTREATTPQAATPQFQLRHQPLHHLIGTPTGHHGRALMPTESPYEERQKLAVSPQNDNARPSKRRKREVSPPSKSGYAQSLFGASLTLSGVPTSTPSVRNKPPKSSPTPIDNQAPESPDPSHHNSRPEPVPKRSHETMSNQKETQVNMSRARLLNRISRPPAHMIIDLESQSSPKESEVVPNEKRNSTMGTKKPQLKRKGDTGDTVIGKESLQPMSVNVVSTDLGVDKSSPLRDRSKRDFPDAACSVAISRSRVDRPHPAPRSKTSVRNEGLSKPKPKNQVEAPNLNEERQGVLQGQQMSEPRTELRIRPRKKRGLFMVSENLIADGSSTSRASKGQTGHRSSFTSFDDAPMEELNIDVLDVDKSINANRESDGPRRKKRSATHSIEDTEVRPSKSKGRRDRETRRRQGENSEAENYEDDITGCPIQNNASEEMEPRTRRRKVDVKQTRPAGPAHEDHIPVEMDGSSRRRKQPSRKKKRLPTEDIEDPHLEGEKYNEKQGMSDEDEFTLPDGLPAPRLAHLGRKSIRSKELIGFLFDEETDHGNALSRNEGEDINDRQGITRDNHSNQSRVQSATPKTETTNIVATSEDRIVTNDQFQQDHASSKKTKVADDNSTSDPTKDRDTTTSYTEAIPHLPERQASSVSVRVTTEPDVRAQVVEDTTAVRQPSAKVVVNPATRGKKAAKPSDAVGQVPQCPLPPDAVVGKPADPGKHENNRQSSRLENRLKETSTAPLPGFARANGGPWSREAHDLFEFTRPS